LKHTLYGIGFRSDNHDKTSAEEEVFRENEDSRYSRLPPESLRLLSATFLGRVEEHFISASLQAPGDAQRNWRCVLKASTYANALCVCSAVAFNANLKECDKETLIKSHFMRKG
jgi:hypothetical protein